MKFASKVVIGVLALVIFAVSAMAQSSDEDQNRTASPTVVGATGLFTVFEARTLKRGEFNVGFFYNNFKRDPGSVHIENMPVNITMGLGRLELFANIDLNQTVTTREPGALSGFLLPNVVSPAFFQGFVSTNGFFTFPNEQFTTGAL